MIWTLYKLELFKMVKRLATWITFFSLLVLFLFQYGSQYYDAWKNPRWHFGFPDAWEAIIEDGAPATSIFTAVIIALLIAAEFDWRTSRQNIIDGLSRKQWLAAKLLLIPTIALWFFGLQLTVAGGLAWAGTDPALANAFSISRVHLLALAGVYLAVLCYASIALFIALLTRSAGAAIGITLIYQVLELMFTRTLRSIELDNIADWFPFQVHRALFDYQQYLAYARDFTLPPGMEAMNTTSLFAAGAGWIVFFVVLSWLVYSTRDL